MRQFWTGSLAVPRAASRLTRHLQGLATKRPAPTRMAIGDQTTAEILPLLMPDYDAALPPTIQAIQTTRGPPTVPSAIEWTEETWNPTTGCTKISPGCKHCYAEMMHKRLMAMGQAKYRQPFGVVTTHEAALTIPLRWRKPRTIFVNSMSDLFHEHVPDEFIDQVFAVMALCRQHTFYVLTKRAERMAEYLDWESTEAFYAWGAAAGDLLGNGIDRQVHDFIDKCHSDDSEEWIGWPLHNVRLGITAEDQPRADERFGPLCELGEAGWNTMVSAEPLLGPVVIPERYLALGNRAWAIVGAESGQRNRAMEDWWASDIVARCRVSGVPVFVKQRINARGRKIPFDQWPANLQVREVPEAMR